MNIIQELNCDIFCVCETHLKGNEDIAVPEYVWFGFNRQLIHINAPRASRGGGIIVNWILNVFDISVKEKSFDGISVLKLRH